MPYPAAIFDVDGTLLCGASAEWRFVVRALRARSLRPGPALFGALRGAAARMRGEIESLVASKDYLSGAACDPLEALAVTCVDTEITKDLRPSILAALQAHRWSGARIVLLSGTLDFLALPLARAVQADLVVATRLERRAGRFTGRILPPHPHGAGKVAALEALAVRADLDLGASHAYANRTSDAAHLLRVGFAHAVAPDRGLRRLARDRAWDILEDAVADRSAGAG